MAISAILLASGYSRRFGSNKLIYEVKGTPLFEGVLSTVFCSGVFGEILVVTCYPEIAEMCGTFSRNHGCRDGFLRVIDNPDPMEGISVSVRLGAAGAKQGNDLMFFPCDLPDLSESLIRKIADASAHAPGAIVCPTAEGRPGNPVLFPAEMREEFGKLSGDVGGRAIMKKHPDRILTVAAAERELTDLDVRPDRSFDE